jgi:hypothetical protein
MSEALNLRAIESMSKKCPGCVVCARCLPGSAAARPGWFVSFRFVSFRFVSFRLVFGLIGRMQMPHADRKE